MHGRLLPGMQRSRAALASRQGEQGAGGEIRAGARRAAASGAVNKARQMSKFVSRRCIMAAVFLAAALLPARGAVSPRDYREADVVLPADVAVPPNVTVIDDTGRDRDLRALISKPTVLVFADYTCQTLCGPIVAFVAASLERSGLRAGEQYRLVFVGVDPEDYAADAARMRRDHLGQSAALSKASLFVMADQPAINALTSALGYRYVYDGEHDQF